MANNCPPHQWDENGAEEGLVLARCIRCGAKQWHATDGSFDTIKDANKRNKRDGLELISLEKRARFMDTSLRKDPPADTVPVPVPPVQDMFAKYDKLAPQVLEDAKTIPFKSSLRKNGIPIGLTNRLKKRWERFDFQDINTASPGRLLYEKHAQDVGLKTPWDVLGAGGKASYERKALAVKPIQPEVYMGRDFEKDKTWGVKGKVHSLMGNLTTPSTGKSTDRVLDATEKGMNS